MRRKPTDRSLRRWLETGRPTSVAHAAETDASVAERLEAMTALRAVHVEAMEELVEPHPEFHDRVVRGVRARVDNYGTALVVADLLGLGFRVGRAMLPPEDDPESAR